MRTHFLATLLGLNLVACAGNISGGPGDDDIPATCGNGVVDQGEECDGTANCNADCTLDQTTPHIAATLDKTTLATSLMTTETVTLTLTASGGFSGAVNVATSVVDGANAPISKITIAGPASVNLTDGQSAPTAYTVTIPSDTTGTALAATLKVDVTSSADNFNLTSTLNVDNQLIIPYKAGTGAAGGANHPVKAGEVPANITVLRGAIIGYKNDDTIVHITHGGGAIPHENVGDPNAGKVGGTYTFNTTAVAPGSTGSMGCHSHDNDAGYVNFTIN